MSICWGSSYNGSWLVCHLGSVLFSSVRVMSLGNVILSKVVAYLLPSCVIPPWEVLLPYSYGKQKGDSTSPETASSLSRGINLDIREWKSRCLIQSCRGRISPCFKSVSLGVLTQPSSWGETACSCFHSLSMNLLDDAALFCNSIRVQK